MGQATADRGLNRHLLPAITVLAGIGAAVGIATAPGPLLDGALDRSGIATLIPMAAAPIGVTGRTLLALGTGGMVALTGFVARIRMALLTTALAARGDNGPVIRRADAHPDAPPRRPIRASSDLGAPLPLEDACVVPMPPVAQALPANLDQPMSMYDPAAVPQRPLEPVRAVAPLARSQPVAEAPVPPRFVISNPAPTPAAVIDAAPIKAPEAVAAAPAPVVEVPAPVAPVQPPRLAAVPIAEGRIETFELTPLVRPAPARVAVAPQGETIADLLARLERGTTRRQATAPREPAPPTLDETLQRLRRLATG